MDENLVSTDLLGWISYVDFSANQRTEFLRDIDAVRALEAELQTTKDEKDRFKNLLESIWLDSLVGDTAFETDWLRQLYRLNDFECKVTETEEWIKAELVEVGIFPDDPEYLAILEDLRTHQKQRQCPSGCGCVEFFDDREPDGMTGGFGVAGCSCARCNGEVVSR